MDRRFRRERTRCVAPSACLCLGAGEEVEGVLEVLGLGSMLRAILRFLQFSSPPPL